MLGGLVSSRNVIQQKTMTSNTRATTTVKTTQTTKSTTKKKKKKKKRKTKQKTNNDHEQCFYVGLPWPLPEEHPEGAQTSPKRFPRTCKIKRNDTQSALKNIAGSKPSNLRACRRILRACRHAGTSRRAPKPRYSRHLTFQSPKIFPRGPRITIYRQCRRSITRSVLAFECWVIGLRCRSNCLHV